MAARLNKLIAVYKDGEVVEEYFRSIDEAKSFATANRMVLGKASPCAGVFIFPMYLDGRGQYKGNIDKAHYRRMYTGEWAYVSNKS